MASIVWNFFIEFPSKLICFITVFFDYCLRVFTFEFFYHIFNHCNINHAHLNSIVRRVAISMSSIKCNRLPALKIDLFSATPSPLINPAMISDIPDDCALMIFSFLKMYVFTDDSTAALNTWQKKIGHCDFANYVIIYIFLHLFFYLQIRLRRDFLRESTNVWSRLLSIVQNNQDASNRTQNSWGNVFSVSSSTFLWKSLWRALKRKASVIPPEVLNKY